MRRFINDCWNGVMDHEKNPLRHIPNIQVRHMVLQLLAWMWCIMFSLWVGSITVFGFTAVAHAAILAAITITVSTFEIAKRKPDIFTKNKK